MYKRPDGLYEKIITINGERTAFRGKSEKIVTHKILEYKGKVKRGRMFTEIAEEWKEEHYPTIEYNTIKCYNPSYKRLCEHFSKDYMREITPIDVNALIISFAKKGYSQKTVRTLLLVANLIFSHAVLNRDIDIIPTACISIPKNLPKAKRDMPTQVDIEIVKNSIDCTFGLFAYFLLYTGCRKGEALALQYQDIDYIAKMIKVSKSVYYISNKAEIKLPKTDAGIRSIILLDRLAEKIPQGKPKDYVFGDEKGNPITAKKFIVMWKKYCEETNLQLTPHQLRHAYATILFEAGVDEKDAQELLGHACIAMTKDIYTHISKTRKEKTAELLNKFNG